MTVAHVAGVPFEELVVPLASTAGVVLVALRVAWTTRRRQAAETATSRNGRAEV